MHWAINDLRGLWIDYKRKYSPKRPQCGIVSWRQFIRHLKNKNVVLLKRLKEFHDSILVTGCQRSGTTIMTRILSQSDGMVNYSSGFDDELAGALILSGLEPHVPIGRYCFQTTYLNDRYQEYFSLPKSVRIIWILRNPEDVVLSMLYNWRTSALLDLYNSCGKNQTESLEIANQTLNTFLFKRHMKACLSYKGKMIQLLELHGKLKKCQFMIVQYENVTKEPQKVLPHIYDFVGLEYKSLYGSLLKIPSSKRKLPSFIQKDVVRVCYPFYEKAKNLQNFI
jgi:hypothetical protein